MNIAVVLGPSTASAATCANPASTYGAGTITYTIPVAGVYRVWSRIQAPDATNNSYYLQVDGGCPIAVGDAVVTANSLVWVDYQDGTTTSKIDITLTAGSHTFVMTGREPGVMLDRVVFSSVASCIPTGTGDNCATAPSPSITPTPTVTPVSTPTPTPVPTPTHKSGDINGDGKINVIDLSIMLSAWTG